MKRKECYWALGFIVTVVLIGYVIVFHLPKWAVVLTLLGLAISLVSCLFGMMVNTVRQASIWRVYENSRR